MIRILPYLIGLLAIFTANLACAQDISAMEYFNRASKEYIKEDKYTALRTLDQGLREHPGDARLLRLAEELVKEEQQQHDEEQEDREQDQQPDDDGDEGDQDGKEKDKGEDPGDGDEPRRQPDEKPERERDQDPGRNREQQQQNEQRRPGSIAPHDARRILDALDRQEKEVLDKVRAKQRPATRIPIEKDW